MERETKVLIAMPSTDYIPVWTVKSLMMLLRRDQDIIQICSGSLVYDARTKLVNEALRQNCTHILFLDSDMVFPEDTLARLLYDDKDIVTALCFGRVGNHPPCAYKKVTKGDDTHTGYKEPIDTDDLPAMLKVDGCGAAVLLIKLDVFKEMTKKFHKWFEPEWNLGEDLSFTERAKELGYEIWCDTTLDIGHIGQAVFTKEDYRHDKTR